MHQNTNGASNTQHVTPLWHMAMMSQYITDAGYMVKDTCTYIVTWRTCYTIKWMLCVPSRIVCCIFCMWLCYNNMLYILVLWFLQSPWLRDIPQGSHFPPPQLIQSWRERWNRIDRFRGWASHTKDRFKGWTPHANNIFRGWKWVTGLKYASPKSCTAIAWKD